MSQLRYPITIVTVSAAVFVVYGFIAGLYTVLNIPPNPCEMTYMFESIKYIPVPVEGGSEKYKLYAYGEGRYAKSLFQGKFNGIPVLFIPGNAGCFKQVRSLASVAYRMHEDLHKLHHFNYFTVDFNEEFSGLYGGVLYTQSDYVVVALQAIQKLYSTPKKVILIGHSMGGLVARSVFVHPEFQYDSVDLVLTLSTPHNAAPYEFDWHIHSFYSEWKSYVKSNPKLYEEKVFVSIGSGIRDTMVQPYQTIIQESGDNTVNVLTTCIPEVQLSPDHLQMVWCRQLVKKITHVLFDMINKDTLQIEDNISLIRDISRVNFLGVQSVFPVTSKKREVAPAVILKDMQFHATVTSREGWKKFVIPNKSGYNTAIIVQNPPRERWLYYCKSDVLECEDISGEITLFPDNLAVYSKRLADTDGKYEVFLHGAHGREKKATRSILTLQHHLGGAVELSSYEPDSVEIADRAEQMLSVPSLSSTDYWVVTQVSVKQGSCTLLKSSQRLPIGRLISKTEDTYSQSVDGGLDIMVELLTVKPFQKSLSHPQIQLILDPACSYTVTIQTDGFRTAANLIKYHYSLFGGALLFVLLGAAADLVRGRSPALLYSLTQDHSNMFMFFFIIVVKVFQWGIPSLHEATGIDWLTVEAEILLTALLTVHTLVYVLCHISTYLSFLLFKLITIIRLGSCRPIFFSWKFQSVLGVAGLLTSGSWANILNLGFLLFFVVSRKNVHPAVKALLLLQIYGTGLQLPVTLSWLKNLSLRLYWLEGDVASRVTLPLSVIGCCLSTTLCTADATTRDISALSVGKVVLVLNLLRFLTVTVVLTRAFLVVPVLYTAILSLAGFFISAPVKSKVS
ncbi:GPI inositol-deacylase-like [Bolinopsis microptera]|uniref:GPI inositol-deacylase-like n=1 Tax=Bolinopsis microptera TaxID=2820187 RepID=UPI0030790ACC